jgi:FHA domain
VIFFFLLNLIVIRCKIQTLLSQNVPCFGVMIMNVSANLCPVCKHKNELEAVVCENCGATLDDPFMDPGAKTKTTDMPALDPESMRIWSVDEEAVPESGIAFYVKGTHKPALLDTRWEFVLGRKVGTTSEGLLDLAPLGGYHLGLSRRHALLRRSDHGYEVVDLGSINGSWLNDERLVPHKAYPLPSGSSLRLGSMELFVLYRPFEKR